MEGQGTIEGSVNGVTSMTYDRKVFFHRVTKEEMEGLMTTSLEFQISTTLSGFSLGALLSGVFSQGMTPVSAAIFVSSIPLTLLLIVSSIYFLIKMNKEKERYFKKYEPAQSTEWKPNEEELTAMVNDLLAQISSLQNQLDSR